MIYAVQSHEHSHDSKSKFVQGFTPLDFLPGLYTTNVQNRGVLVPHVVLVTRLVTLKYSSLHLVDS